MATPSLPSPLRIRSRAAALAVAIAGAGAAAAQPPAPYLVKDIETRGVPAPQYNCPLIPCPDVFGSVPGQLLPFGDRLAFVGFDPDHGVEPWVSDGTAEGTRRLADLAPGEESSAPCLLGVAGGRLLLGADLDAQPWFPLLSSDGGAVEPLHRTSVGCNPLGFEANARPLVDGRLLYELVEGLDGEGPTRLWLTDGSATEALVRLCPFPDEPFPGRPCTARIGAFGTFGDALYVEVDFGLLGPFVGWLARLYRLPVDGPPVLEAVAETCADEPELDGFTELGGAVYVASRCLAAMPGVSGLFRIDGESVELVHRATAGTVRSPMAAGGFVYYLVDAAEGVTVWRTDGSSGGTGPVFGGPGTFPDPSPRPVGDRLVFGAAGTLYAALPDGTVEAIAAASRGRLAPVGSRLAFAGFHPATGAEPWITDGTAAGSRPLGDVEPGPEGSHPTLFTRAGDRVFFSAETEEVGRELWAVDLPVDAEPPPPPPFPEWIESPAFSEFRFQVRISPVPLEVLIRGTEVPACQDDTVCVSGAVPGRPEVYLRILGPRPNGFLWPTIIRFTPSRVEVWVEQESTGQVNYYDLPPVGPGDEDLPGRQDRRGFQVP